METVEILMLTRSIERIIAILLGGAAIYMAFRLFLNLPNVNATDDNFKFRTYFSYHFLKIAMGAVFMMFGATIVLFSFFKAPKYSDQGQNIEYSGMGGKMDQAAKNDKIIDSAQFPFHISTLNGISKKMEPELNPVEFRDVAITISRVKLNLMLSVWDEERWGDKIAFRNWVVNGENPVPAPEDNVSAEAIKFFDYIQK